MKEASHGQESDVLAAIGLHPHRPVLVNDKARGVFLPGVQQQILGGPSFLSAYPHLAKGGNIWFEPR